MGVSWAVRSLRAAVFAVVCVLLAVGGHTLATGAVPPVWVDAAGFLPVFAVGAALAGRERSLSGIALAMLLVQVGLHLAFDAAGPSGAQMPGMTHGMRMAGPPHAMSPPAVAAHLAAALLASWCLRRGEAAVWSLLHKAAALVPRLAVRWQTPPLPTCARQLRPDTGRPRLPRQALLRHALSRRGPPTAAPYPVRPPTHKYEYGVCPPMSTTRITLRRATTVAALAAVGVLTGAGAAFAHVTVHPESYAKGATDGVLTFRVPNEEDTAATTKVQVFLPTGHPVLGVLVTPENGWTAQVTTTKLKTPVKTDDGTITDAVSEITWTGGRIGHGQYQDFTVAFGQLPDNADQLTFKTLQTYSDGNVVRWIEEVQKGQNEPENPAPVLQLTAKGTAEGGGAGTAPASDARQSSATATKAAGSDSTARGLGIAGLVAGVLGLAAAGFALARGRAAGSSGTPTPE